MQRGVCLTGVALALVWRAIPAQAQASTARPVDESVLDVPAPPPGAALPPVEPIITDEEFKTAIPKLAPEDDPELSRPLETIEAFEQRMAAERAAARGEAGQPQPAPATTPAIVSPAAIGSAAVQDAELTAPLPPLETFEVRPTTFAEAPADTRVVEVGYLTRLSGLPTAEGLAHDLSRKFHELSALRHGKGKAANLAQLTSRVSEDAVLLRKLLAAQGWFDAQVKTRVDRSDAGNGQPLTAVLDVVPGKRFAYSQVAIAAGPTVPPDLIRSHLDLQVGQPVVAEEVLGAEAKVAVALPEGGYPFAEVGQRDVLLNPDTGEAVYTLPVTIGPRGAYGEILTTGKLAFDADHVRVMARFKSGQPYDSRQVDDLRQALIATGLFKAVAVEPRRTGRPGPDGTELVNLEVKQDAGPPRVIAATAGYGTGEGFRAEASWTHRNLFPPEGALIASGLVGTQEQGAGVTFRRSNAGRRDRAFELAADLHHSQYDAYSAYTGRLSTRFSYDSTPLWQKRLTYAYGAQLLGTNESVYVPARAGRTRRTYVVGGLSGQAGFDTTDSLLDPARGFRLTALVEPELSLHGSLSPYVRARLDGSAYYRVGKSLVLAGRARVASIQGAALDDLAPSRRLYAGGGGSVRGFGYQQLGPRDPNNDPTGGRSLNEAAFEVRYRFGDYGVVAFTDIGQAYQSATPRFSDLRAGVGLGVRVYTNFGPMRIDVATPVNRRKGESKVNVYVSIGQAF